MFAIFESGGKQYRAEAGSVIKLEKLPYTVGDRVALDKVLFFADGENLHVGQPYLGDTVVRGRVVEQGRHAKITIFKYKRRKGYRKKQGHRQYYTAVLVEGIERDSQHTEEIPPTEEIPLTAETDGPEVETSEE
jgi:large subunit ribosomal protein L21